MDAEDIPFQILREITDGFSEERKLGQGAFGVVYKGVTRNGDDVAVKLLLPNSSLDYGQLKNEFYNLRKINHQNIVQVLGYCFETEQNPFIMPDGSKVFVNEIRGALCLEYMHNGSLQRLLLSDEFPRLEWHTRFRIIKGTCEGLKYIHEELEEPIYHLDLKPDNILLDKDMVPKIADFGLSRIFCEEPTRFTQNPYGTLGYQPPEYIDKGEISGKFDIFSLGVVMIRIVSGPQGYPKCLDMSSDEFIDQVQKNWRNRLQVTYSSGSLVEAYCHQVKTCIQIALLCVLEDSQKRPNIGKITEMLNEIETTIGELPQKGCLKKVYRIAMHNNKNIDMRKESEDNEGRHQNINLMTGPSCSELEFVDAPEASSDVVEKLIVGRTEEKGKIIASLLEGMSEKIIILPIYGIGGIGKTTFARLIYNDPNFKCYSHVWVDVSRRFDLNKICESVISQLSGKESQTIERQIKHSCLPELLSGKKILIVLDDLWEEDQFHLQELKDMLYHAYSNIIILVTTHSECVAGRICTNLQPYKILPLTNDMCWDIIKHRSAFESRDDRRQWTDIGREIAHKCGGVALAAQSLGFTLRSMNFDQWIKVKDSDTWNEPISNDASLPNDVLASLKLSYSHMDSSLQPCFTYCAIFPKGHKIVKDDLICQWISLDFFKPSKILSNLQLCEKYIAQLLGLSFFQHSVLTTTSEAYYKQATFFTMHDLVHDLAISLLGNKILDQSKQGNTSGSNCQYALLRDCSRPLELCLTSQAGLIALRFLDDCRSNLSGAAFAPAMSLRVLDLSKCFIQRLPDSIGQLKQLRYLNAPKIQNEIVPECITKLSNLIYLNLRGSNITTLPKSIGELKSLMHLDLSKCQKIHELPVLFRNLEKLVHLDLSKTYIITGVSESLQRLSRLEHLNLSGCVTMDLTGAISGLTGLQYLNLSHAFCVGLQPALVNLTKLRYLNLEKIRLCDGGLDVEAGFDSLLECVCSLSNLEYLNLSRNDNLRTITESIRNLRKLNTLDLTYCNNLQRLPSSVSAINSLKFLQVSGCSKFDKSTLSQNKNSSTLLPHFVVHAGDGESSSNISELEDIHLTLLDIIRLENVKSAEEAKRIKLAEKQSIKELELAWTRDAKRFADDREVLSELVPPDRLDTLRVTGYDSISFPSWMMSIATYLHGLRDITLRDLPSCHVLPPLGQLPWLMFMYIDGMDSIRKIDGSFYGGRGAFPQLWRFKISRMECLEEWNAEDGLHELAFPRLQDLSINRCPLLRFKACWPRATQVNIDSSDQILLSSRENRGPVSTSSSAKTTKVLEVTCCEAPLHQWSLLRHLPCLKELKISGCPHLTLQTLTVKGYDSISFPSWLMSIATYLPQLREVTLRDLPSCDVLPPLGQFPNLEQLEIYGMGSIRKIDGGFYGGSRAFPRLLWFSLSHMDCLEEWSATYSSDEDALNELAFPKLICLSINRCPLLSFKTCLPPSRGVEIHSSDQVLLSSWENRGTGSLQVNRGHVNITTCLSVECCEAPLHQWNLLRHLPYLKRLQISGCSDLTCISTDLLQCISSLEILIVENCKSGTVALPETLGDLTSLKELKVLNCNGINAIPESIRQLTCLRRLEISRCPGLVQWCESEENMMKLAHIKKTTLYDGCHFFLLERLNWMVVWPPRGEQKLENKGGFSKAQDGDGKNERDEASKQWGKDLKLSRDFESLMTKNEKSCASEAGHDANALEDLPAQQFSLESWIGSTTPGTSRTIGLDGCFLFFDERPGCLAASREQKLENKVGFSKAQDDDDSKYEREASKQWGLDLKLSRDFESLTIKDGKSGALEDLPVQQFSLGS